MWDFHLTEKRKFNSRLKIVDNAYIVYKKSHNYDYALFRKYEFNLEKVSNS